MNGALSVLAGIVHDYLLLFAMVNVVGNLPLFADLTRGMPTDVRLRTFRTAVFTACSIVVAFSLLGDWMLREVFRVGIPEFKVAGGVLVFLVAVRGMVLGPASSLPRMRGEPAHVAVFPMGFPFLAGPGTIVTAILLMQSEGGPWTALVAILVYASVLPILRLSFHLERTVGRMGSLVVARVLYIFIAAKAVSFVLTGLRQAWEAR